MLILTYMQSNKIINSVNYINAFHTGIQEWLGNILGKNRFILKVSHGSAFLNR